MPDQPKKQAFSVQTYLVAIVAIAVLPLFGFSVVMVSRILAAERTASERLLVKTADELALAFDQEVISTMRTLQSMARSLSLQNHDIRAFHAEVAMKLHTQSSWHNLLLHDLNGKTALSARVPFGKALPPPAEPESLRAIIADQRPRVGNIALGSAAGSKNSIHAFPVRVPVVDEKGKPIYVLTAVISTDALAALMDRFSHAPGEWTRALADSQGTVGARSRSPEKFVGGKLSDTLIALLRQGGDSGLRDTHTLEGVHVKTSWRRASVSGWYTAIAVPMETFNAPATRTLQAIFWVALAILSFSAVSIALFSRWFRRSIRSAADGAASLARGETPHMQRSRITELEELRKSQLSASKLLRSRDRAKSEFLANMSHELRTPLGIVLGMADLLSKNVLPAADRARSWEILERNGQQLLRLIDDILDFSKIEAKRLTVENVEFSLPDLVSSVVEDFGARALEKGIELRMSQKEGAPGIINSDPVRVRQVLFNLVGNAVKFTHEGAVVVRVSGDGQGIARITISDTGIGLSDVQQSVLFNDFTQGDSSHTRKYGGTGLGLSLSRKIARLLGGDVKLLESGPGKGSVFEMTFRAPPGKTHAATQHSSAPVRRMAPGKSVLLAEDSPDNVFWIKACLEDFGVKVSVAENGRQAVEKARAGDFDLILMDIQMPDMDGYEATKRIREEGMHLPIIALTAHALDEHRSRALMTGFTDFLTKPVQPQALIESVQKNLRG